VRDIDFRGADMGAKWLISINPPREPVPGMRQRDVYKLHGPFESIKELHMLGGTIASDLGYPDELVFAAFEIVDGKPVLIFSDE
jgi:hypothetical protein